MFKVYQKERLAMASAWNLRIDYDSESMEVLSRLNMYSMTKLLNVSGIEKFIGRDSLQTFFLSIATLCAFSVSDYRSYL